MSIYDKIDSNGFQEKEKGNEDDDEVEDGEASDYEYAYDDGGGENFENNDEYGDTEDVDASDGLTEDTVGLHYEGDSLQEAIEGSLAKHNILVECKRIAKSCFVDISPSFLSATVTLNIKNGQKILFTVNFPEKEPYFPAAPPVITMLSKIKYPHSKFNVIFSCIPQLLPSRWNPCMALDEIFKEMSKISQQFAFIADALDDENSIIKDLIAVMRILSVDISTLYPTYDFSSLPSIFVFSKEPSIQSIRSFSGTGYSSHSRVIDVSVDTTVYQLQKIKLLIILCERVKAIRDSCRRDTLDSNMVVADCIYLIIHRLISPTITLDEFCRNIDYYKEIVTCLESLPAPSEDAISLLPIEGFSHLLDKSVTVRECLDEEERLLLDRIYIVNSGTSGSSSHVHDQSKVQDEVVAEAIIGKKRASSPPADLPQSKPSHEESGSKIIQLEEPFQQHKFLLEMGNTAHLTAKWYRQMMVELASMEDALPNNVRVFSGVSVSQPNLMQVLMFPESVDCPYCGGCFIFDVYIPANYPAVPPKVQLVTTGYGTVRFNPNLYNCGKVCLSLLGTWEGEPWDPKNSCLAQVINSILFLIFVDEPFFNEPGHEARRGATMDNRSRDYNLNLRVQTLRFAYLDHFKKLNSFKNSGISVDKKVYEIMGPLLSRNWKEKGRKVAEVWGQGVPTVAQLVTEIDAAVETYMKMGNLNCERI